MLNISSLDPQMSVPLSITYQSAYLLPINCFETILENDQWNSI